MLHHLLFTFFLLRPFEAQVCQFRFSELKKTLFLFPIDLFRIVISIMVDVDDHYEKMHFILMVVVEKTVDT